MTYGYTRVSTHKQNLERQIRNIADSKYSCDKIYADKYTGTKLHRPEFDKLLKVVKSGDTIVFDSVSRMSRDAAEGFALYQKLYNDGISLVFLNEPMIDTAVYSQTQQLATVGNEIADCYIKATNEVLQIIAKRQIQIAFDQAQKEVDDLHKRTADGMKAAGACNLVDDDGNVLEQGSISLAKTGSTYKVKKSADAKEIIRTHSKTFGGSLSDAECQKLAGISRNSFYKYKKEIAAE